MEVLLVTLHHNINIAQRREAACYSRAMLPGRALFAAGCDPSSRVARWLIIAITDLKLCISSPLPKFCTTLKCMQTFPGASFQQLPARSSILGKRLLLTFLLGTHMGVPCFTWPASTTTPITIGSRELKINWGSIFILHGNTAICLEDNKEKVFWNRCCNSNQSTQFCPLSHSLDVYSNTVTWQSMRQENSLLILFNAPSSRTVGDSDRQGCHGFYCDWLRHWLRLWPKEQ